MATNREAFNKIAQSWYGFRHYSRFQSELQEMALRWKSGRLLNVGCGHGADFIPFKDNFELFGLDFSHDMINQAQKYSSKFDFETDLLVGDAGYLPFNDGSFDWAIGIAVYHHISGKAERRRAFAELRRILKPGSEAFITVWNRWQSRFLLSGQDTYVPWKTKDQVLNRYYHLFTYIELKRLINESGFRIIDFWPPDKQTFARKYFSRNIELLIKAV